MLIRQIWQSGHKFNLSIVFNLSIISILLASFSKSAQAINFLEKEKISQSEKVTKLKASGSIAWADLENDARRIDIIDKLNTTEKLKL